MNELPFYLIKPKRSRVPFVLSIPHCGIEFPDELVNLYDPGLLRSLDDTDWYLDKLYDFASELGITVIYAKYSRWVIDLNREPDSIPLYDDGRLTTALCPTTDFNEQLLYVNDEDQPDDDEIDRRLTKYFYPYHRAIDSIVKDLKVEFERVLFWDAHSIRRVVPSIQSEPFPDFILGNNDLKSAAKDLSEIALASMNSKNFEVNYNDPFKGGYLTRTKGDPASNVHALQLEMSKDLYMSKNETMYDDKKAAPIKALLKTTFEKLIPRI